MQNLTQLAKREDFASKYTICIKSLPLPAYLHKILPFFFFFFLPGMVLPADEKGGFQELGHGYIAKLYELGFDCLIYRGVCPEHIYVCQSKDIVVSCLNCIFIVSRC